MIFRPACVSDAASPPPGRRELVRSVSALSISFLKINQKSVSRFLTRRIRGKKVFTRKLFFQSCWFFFPSGPEVAHDHWSGHALVGIVA